MTGALKAVPKQLPNNQATRDSETIYFLRSILGDHSPFCFQAINSEKGYNQAILLPAGAGDAELTKAFRELDGLNRRGYDIYFVVNRLRADYKLTPLNIGGRVIYQHKGGDADICGINALFPDFDKKKPKTLEAIEDKHPTAISETSKGNFHAFWRVEGDIPVSQFGEYQAALRQRFAEFSPDESVSNPSRLMRLPGFRHIKAKLVPLSVKPFEQRFVTKVLRCADILKVTPDELLLPPLNLKLEQQATKPRSSSDLISQETLDQFNAGGDVDGDIDSGDDAAFEMAGKRIKYKQALDNPETAAKTINDLKLAIAFLREHPDNPLGLSEDGEPEDGTGTYDFWIDCGQALAFAKGTESEQECKALWESMCNDPKDAEAKWRTFTADRTCHAAIIKKAKALGWVDPSSVSKGYRVEPDGVFKLAPPDSEKPDTLICGRLIVSAFARDVNGDNSGLLLRWVDKDGRERERPIAAKRLNGDAKGVIAELADGGLYIDPEYERFVMQYLARFNTDQRALVVTATGWQGECFVLAAGEVLKPDHITDRIVSYEAANSGTSIKGTLAQWQANNAQLCVGNPVLSFAVSTAFVAPLLEPLGAEGFGFHYQGKSSSGKSTALMLASSVFGKGSSGADGYCASWNGTVNAIETLLPKRSGLLLALDELSQANDARTISSTIMALGNGSSKGRLTKDAKERGTKTFRTAVLSSGERTPAKELERLSKGSNAQLDAGHEVRLPSIRVSEFPNAQGCFHNTQGKAPAEFAGMVKTAAAECYGAAGRKWLEYLVANRPNIAEQVERYRADWLAQYTGNRKLGAQQMRVANNFALVAAAGELATSVGITGWKAGAAAKDTGVMFDHYLNDRGVAEVSETVKILDAVKHSLMTQYHRFQPADDTTRPPPNRLGFVECEHNGDAEQGADDWIGVGADGADDDVTLTGEIRYFIPSAKSLEELAQGFDAQMIAKTLAEAGALECPPKGNRHQVVMRPNKSRRRFAGMPSTGFRCYVIRGDKLTS